MAEEAQMLNEEAAQEDQRRIFEEEAQREHLLLLSTILSLIIYTCSNSTFLSSFISTSGAVVGRISMSIAFSSMSLVVDMISSRWTGC